MERKKSTSSSLKRSTNPRTSGSSSTVIQQCALQNLPRVERISNPNSSLEDRRYLQQQQQQQQQQQHPPQNSIEYKNRTKRALQDLTNINSNQLKKTKMIDNSLSQNKEREVEDEVTRDKKLRKSGSEIKQQELEGHKEEADEQQDHEEEEVQLTKESESRLLQKTLSNSLMLALDQMYERSNELSLIVEATVAVPTLTVAREVVGSIGSTKFSSQFLERRSITSIQEFHSWIILKKSHQQQKSSINKVQFQKADIIMSATELTFRIWFTRLDLSSNRHYPLRS